jgi:hypothetical protein
VVFDNIHDLGSDIIDLTPNLAGSLISTLPRANRQRLLRMIVYCRSFRGVGHIPPSGTPPQPQTTTTSTRDSFVTMTPINGAIAFLRSSNRPDISEAARMFKVERSVLSKHFRGNRVSIAKADETKQLSTNERELMLVNETQRLCDWCLPPTPAIVTLWASHICSKEPGKNWAVGFKARHKDILDCRYLTAIDLARHKTESKASHNQYFTIVRQKVEQYSIQLQNCYNMD